MNLANNRKHCMCQRTHSRLTLQHKASDLSLPGGCVMHIMMDVLQDHNAEVHKPQYHVNVATKFCTVACSVCGSSVRNYIHVIFVVPRALRDC